MIQTIINNFRLIQIKKELKEKDFSLDNDYKIIKIKNNNRKEISKIIEEIRIKRIIELKRDNISQSEYETFCSINDGLSKIRQIFKNKNIKLGSKPDFFVYKKDLSDYIFLEFKSNSDVLRVSQLNWFINHNYINCGIIIATI